MRACAVTIGPQPGTGVRVDQRFRVAFQIEQDDTEVGNSMVVQMYGLGQTTRGQIERDNQTLLLEAGYGEDVETLAVMDVSRVLVRRDPPELSVVVECNDGGPPLADRRVSVSIAGATTVRAVAERVAELAALNLRVVDGVDLSQPLDHGYSYAGTARRALDNVLARNGVEWSMQDGEIVVKPPGQPADRTAVVLGPESGMIRSPERLDDDLVVGYSVESLLNPRLRPGALVELRSREVEGSFVVKRVTHSGDTRGSDWISRAEVEEL